MNFFNKTKKFGLASDNCSGVHPSIFEALVTANELSWTNAYGNDPLTDQANKAFRAHLGACQVQYVFLGTGANMLALESLAGPYGGVICSSVAHIANEEAAAPSRSFGQLLTLPAHEGKLSASDLDHYTPIGTTPCIV